MWISEFIERHGPRHGVEPRDLQPARHSKHCICTREAADSFLAFMRGAGWVDVAASRPSSSAADRLFVVSGYPSASLQLAEFFEGA